MNAPHHAQRLSACMATWLARPLAAASLCLWLAGPAQAALPISPCPATEPLLAAGQTPPMALAQATVTSRDALPLPIGRYWVSEKYDGVRAWWDGRSLRTRQGQPIAAPAWFTAGWPCTVMDGELWAGRGRFEQASGTVQSLQPDEAAWRAMRFMVFDLPAHPGPFDARLAHLRKLARQAPAPSAATRDIPSTTGHTGPFWTMAPQWREANFASLQTRMRTLHAQGAEGLMLHDGQALHAAGRSAALIKFKPIDDAEAVVIGHVPGKGKHEGRMGALVVRNAAGQQFRIGTGFTDAQRATPPAVGTTITYAHQGFTAKGLPRFTRFVRVRSDGVTLAP